MNNNSIVLSTFIKQLDECLEDIIAVYPKICETDDRFLKCKLYFDALKKANPRIMIVTWKSMVNDRYRAQILAGDVDFFVKKDYQEDAREYYNETIEGAIDDLRTTIREMSPENIKTSMKYIQNLCKLGDLYSA
jgi:hypothetical protein